MATVAQPRPEPLARPVPVSGLLSWIASLDHKRIAILYLVTSVAFFLIGGVMALLMRAQLFIPRNDLVSPQTFNALFTMHGTTMIFLVVMPALIGFYANYIVPLQIGARDMAFPRLNLLSYWLFLFGALLIYFGYTTGEVPNVGWFAYAPLTERPFSTTSAVEYWALGLIVTSIGSIITGVNLVVTIANLRAPGMTAFRMPIFVWMMLVTGALILGAIPALTAAQAMLEVDRLFGGKFFDAAAGGNVVLWQHLFWYFGHPEVYILALPCFGIISEVVPVFARKPIFGYQFVVASGMGIAFFSMLVWAHHMFTVGLGFWENFYFGAASMVIAIPTGVKVFTWLGTLWRGRIRFTIPMKFALAMIATFTMGGVTGVHFATVPISWQANNSYYLVAHFHTVVAGLLLAMLAGLYYWWPKISGRMLDEGHGNWVFWLTFVGLTLSFFPMHIVGLMGMPRRVFTYPDLPGWAFMNQIETVGSFMVLAAMLILAWSLAKSLRQGRIAGNDPWDAWTLEWATTSPPAAENFPDGLPRVESHRPLWDLKSGRTVGAVGVAAERPTTGLSNPVLGTLVFLVSEVTFFGALIVAYLMYRTASFTGPGPEVLPLGRTALFSVALFASSGTIALAERRLHRDDLAGFRLWWLATIVLGTIFLLGQVTEYTRLYSEGIVIGTNLFTSAFYTLTGFHGLHVTMGLVALAIVARLAFAGEFTTGRGRSGVQAVSIYWHFVDVVWVVVFSLVYLWR